MNEIRKIMLEVFGLEETILEKGILKAIFLIGGPGSGKSTVIKALFPSISIKHNDDGTPVDSKGNPVNLPSGSDIVSPVPKIIDTDTLFTKKLSSAGLPQKLASPLSKTPENIALYKKQQEIRSTAIKTTIKVLNSLLNGYHSIILDGTGKDVAKMEQRKKILESLGYDTYALFVNTDLQTSKKRNKTRERSLSDDLVEEIWEKVQAAIPTYKNMFSDNFYMVNGNDGQQNVKELRDVVGKWLKSPLTNPIGQELVAVGQKEKPITRQVAAADVSAFEQVELPS